LGGKVISIIAKPQIYYNSKRLWSQGPQTRWTWLVSNGPARKYKNPFYPARTIVVNLRAMERGGGVASFSGDVVAEATKQARNRRAKHPFVNTK